MSVENPSYRLCFAGVSLPPNLESRFKQVSYDLRSIIPGLTLMTPRVPGHITGAYLGDLQRLI